MKSLWRYTMMNKSPVETNPILKEFKKHFNEPVLIGLEVMRVIGYSEDDMDCYLMVQDVKGRILHHTAVGGYIFLDELKNQGHVKAHNGEDWDDLSRLDSWLTCGKAPKQDEFLIEHFEVVCEADDK